MVEREQEILTQAFFLFEKKNSFYSPFFPLLIYDFAMYAKKKNGFLRGLERNVLHD